MGSGLARLLNQRPLTCAYFIECLEFLSVKERNYGYILSLSGGKREMRQFW